MRYGDARHGQLLDCGVDQTRASTIQMAGGLVQDQNTRRATEGTRQLNRLFLTARQTAAHITNQALKAHWHR